MDHAIVSTLHALWEAAFVNSGAGIDAILWGTVLCIWAGMYLERKRERERQRVMRGKYE